MADVEKSPSLFCWLLGFGNPPRERPADLDEFSAACEFALSEWHVLPAIAPRLLAWGGDLFSASPQASKVGDRLVSLEVLSKIQLTLLRRLTEKLEQQEIPFVLLKGTATRVIAYDNPEQRTGLDLDIGVPRQFLGKAQRTAELEGFLPAQWNPSEKHFRKSNPVLRSIVEKNHYELGFLARRQTVEGIKQEVSEAIRRDIHAQDAWHVTADGRLACYVTVDIHHGISPEISVDDIVNSRILWASSTYSAWVPQLEWVLLHLVYKLYWESAHNYGKGAYQYADVVRILPHVRGERLTSFLGLLSKYKLEAAAHYVLRRVEGSFSLPLNHELSTFLVDTYWPPSGSSPLELNDVGDMWPKLWGHR